MFTTMVNYWDRTGDDTWVEETKMAIQFQSDPSSGGFFDSKNVSAQLGNDDQAFWAFAAMRAAELNFPNPGGNYASWVAMAQGVFNQQVQRWDPDTCNGGLRWQVFPFNQGYDYKNSISNGCFFNLAARLGKYTGNSTYSEAAEKWWDWSVTAGLIDTSDYGVIDGITVEACDDHGHTEEWTYNVGVYLAGAAAMWNLTQGTPDSGKWQERVTGLVNACGTFMKADPTGAQVLTEVICEPQNTCKVDASTFKAYLARWMRDVALVAPFTADQIDGMLSPSIPAIGLSCTGPPKYSSDGVTCGQSWYTGSFDGKTGIGMQMTALEMVQTLLPSSGWLDVDSASSKGDPAAGSQEVGQLDGTFDNRVDNIGTGDKAGAAILTIMLCVSSMTGAWWILK